MMSVNQYAHDDGRDLHRMRCFNRQPRNPGSTAVSGTSHPDRCLQEAAVVSRVLKIAGLIALAMLVLASAIWSGLTLLYTVPQNGLHIVLATGAAMASAVVLAALFSGRLRWRALAVQALVFTAVMSWWTQIAPSNERPWQTDVSVLPYATIEGDMVTVHNVRNFDYRSETDFTPAWYDKRLDLRKLEGVDLVAVYWMGPAIAHIFLSFAFTSGDHLAVSIETRKEQGEDYSTLKGFFRRYELYYVVADERDVIRLRTNYRQNPPEDVYVYRLQGRSLEGARHIFIDYINKINSLKAMPEFYNTLTTNCTTNIWFHSRVNPDHLPFSWKILASGYVPQYLHESGLLDRSLPFAELQRRSHVNPRAQAAADAPDFSRRIRAEADAAHPSQP